MLKLLHSKRRSLKKKRNRRRLRVDFRSGVLVLIRKPRMNHRKPRLPVRRQQQTLASTLALALLVILLWQTQASRKRQREMMGVLAQADSAPERSGQVAVALETLQRAAEQQAGLISDPPSRQSPRMIPRASLARQAAERLPIRSAEPAGLNSRRRRSILGRSPHQRPKNQRWRRKPNSRRMTTQKTKEMNRKASASRTSCPLPALGSVRSA
mmetsp:Transcript_9592/g.17517  ORF Transcript_9592/g.17517 Transcript_9592/m.17517 type:complete len:212 (+) Transcript_9592:795-1430(+)